MRRRMAVSVMALGAVVTLIGGTGIWAVFTDRATTGQNSVTSGALPQAADLLITQMGNQLGDCQGFTDDLATGLFTVTDAGTGNLAVGFVCLKNNGSSALDVSMTAIDLVDVETGCTGDEAAAGDTTCGTNAVPPTGELSASLQITIGPFDCVTGQGNSGFIQFLDVLAGSSMPAGSLAVGEIGCYQIEVRIPVNLPVSTYQISQSDQSTWRLAFDGTTPA